MRQNLDVVWIQCLLVDVVRHTDTLALDHVDICTPKTVLVASERSFFSSVYVICIREKSVPLASPSDERKISRNGTLYGTTALRNNGMRP